MEAMRCELEDSKKRLSTRLLEIEELSDKLQIAAADIVKLEQRNGELEESLANRSTETEAQHRKEEVFQLQEDLRLSREQYELKTIELAEKVLAIGVSATRIEELEVMLNNVKAEAEDWRARSLSKSNLALVGLLEGKIERLRSERDELRQTMSFAKHEHRFALEAAEADRLSAKAELEKAKVDLDNRTIELDTVKSDLSAHRDQLDSLSVELDNLRRQMVEATTEKNHALDDQIRQLQAELDGTKADRDEMRESSIALFNRYSELEQQMAHYTVLQADFSGLREQYQDTHAKWEEAEKNRMLALAERDECLEKLDSLRPVESSSLSSASGSAIAGVQAAGELPILDLRTRKHSRRSSLQAFQDHYALEQGKKMELLENRLKEERDRVGRREGEHFFPFGKKGTNKLIYTGIIESLRREVDRANLAAQVARDDLADEIEDLTTKHNTATRVREERISQLEGQVVQSQAEFESAKKGLADAEAALADLQNDVAKVTAELEDANTQTAVLRASREELSIAKVALLEQIDTAREATEAAQTARLSTEASLAESREQLASLSSKVATLETELASTLAASSSAAETVATLMASLANAQTQLVESQTSLQDFTKRIAELEAELASTQTKLSTLQSERDSLRQAAGSESESTRQEMEQMFTEQHELKAQIKGLEEKVRTLEGEMEVLMLDMGASDEAHSEGMKAKEAEVDGLKLELHAAQETAQAVRAEATEMKSTLQTVQQEMTTLEQVSEAVKTELQAQSGRLEAEIATARAEKAEFERTHTAAKDMESKAEQEITSLRADVERFTNDLLAARSEAERATTDLESARATLSTSENRVAELTASHERLTSEKEREVLQRQERVSQLETQLEELSKVQINTVNRLAASASDAARAEILTQLDIASQAADVESEKAAILRTELESAQARLALNDEAVSAQREECSRLYVYPFFLWTITNPYRSADLAQATQQLAQVQSELNYANVQVESKQADLDAAYAKQEALARQLAEPPSTSVSTDDVQALEQKLHGEFSLF